MKVKEAIELLERLDGEAEVIYTARVNRDYSEIIPLSKVYECGADGKKLVRFK